MTTTAPQTVTTEEIKQAILLLIKENNAELKQFLGEFFNEFPLIAIIKSQPLPIKLVWQKS